MSKSRQHKYKEEEEVVTSKKPGPNRIKEKRIDRALRTKNIDELMELDDDGDEPTFYYEPYDYDEDM